MQSPEENNMDHKRTTVEQLEFFVAFISDHPQLLANKNDPTDPERVKNLWSQLGEALNAMNGPNRSAAKWKDTLSHWKNQLRSRARKAKVDQITTGGGPPSKKKFKDFEERALEAFGAIAVDGHPAVPTLGLDLQINLQTNSLMSSQENDDTIEYENAEFLESSFLSSSTTQFLQPSTSNIQQHCPQPSVINAEALPTLLKKTHKKDATTYDIMNQVLQMTEARDERDKKVQEENILVQKSLAEALKSLADSIRSLSEAIASPSKNLQTSNLILLP